MAEHFRVNALPQKVDDFITHRHLATLSIPRGLRAPHVTPVGFTFDDTTGLARVITWASSVKARLIAGSPGTFVTVCQIDGPNWLAFSGPATLSDDPHEIAEAVQRYARRYRQPKERDDRVVLQIAVETVLGRVSDPAVR